jgi:hypothetical protein
MIDGYRLNHYFLGFLMALKNRQYSALIAKYLNLILRFYAMYCILFIISDTFVTCTAEEKKKGHFNLSVPG